MASDGRHAAMKTPASMAVHCTFQDLFHNDVYRRTPALPANFLAPEYVNAPTTQPNITLVKLPKSLLKPACTE